MYFNINVHDYLQFLVCENQYSGPGEFSWKEWKKKDCQEKKWKRKDESKSIKSNQSIQQSETEQLSNEEKNHQEC